MPTLSPRTYNTMGGLNQLLIAAVALLGVANASSVIDLKPNNFDGISSPHERFALTSTNTRPRRYRPQIRQTSPSRVLRPLVRPLQDPRPRLRRISHQLRLLARQSHNRQSRRRC